MSETVELKFIVDGDSGGATGALDRAGRSADDVDDKFRKASENIGGGFDKATESADNLDTKAMGFRDTMTGVQDTMSGAALIAKGDLFNGFFTLGMGVGDLASGMVNFLIPALSAAASGSLSTAVATARSTVANVANRVSSIAAAAASKAWAAGQWLLNAALTANPIGLVILAIVALVALLVVAWRRSSTFRAVVQAAMRGVQVAFGWVLAKVQQLVGWIRGNWPRLLAILTGPIGLAVRFILSRWDSIRSGVVSKTAALIGFVRGIPGRIRSAVGNLGNLLRGAGRAIIDGLIGGIRAGFDRVRGILSSLTGMLPDWKGPRRVDENILRPSGDMVAGGFEAGFVERFTGRTRAVMGDLTTSLPAAVGGGRGRGAGPGGGDVHIHTPAVITSDRQLRQLIDRAQRNTSAARTYVTPAVV